MAITSKSISQGNAQLAGYPLFQCLSGMREVINACELHNQHWNQKIIRMSAQFVVNLSGRNSLNSPYELTGEFMKEKDVEAGILRDKNEVQLLWLYFLKFMMAVYLCDFSIALKAEALIKPLRKYKNNAAFCTLQAHIFHEGLLLCFQSAAAGKKNKRRGKILLSHAEKTLKAIQYYATICPANYQHKALLLGAEIESIKKVKSTSDIALMYCKAAEGASEEGFLHEQALALEKGGRFLLKDFHDSRWTVEARSFFSEAVKVYREHGSMLKVDQLEKILDRWEEIINSSIS
jgi:hypothetical protein